MTSDFPNDEHRNSANQAELELFHFMRNFCINVAGFTAEITAVCQLYSVNH